MTADRHLNPRERAERRIRQRHERARNDLFRQSQAQRAEILRRQQDERARHTAQQTLVTERRKETLAKHDRQWERERQRLSSMTTRSPGFGLFGPPQRNLQHEYAERRERWEKQRAVIEQAFDEQRDRLHDDRIEMAERHTREIASRERWDRLAHDDLARRQERTFDAAVEKELRRGERTTSRAFAREAADPGRER